MLLPYILASMLIGLIAAVSAWYYNRESQVVRYEYLGSAGQVDDMYIELIRPLHARRRIALCVVLGAVCVAAILVGFQHLATVPQPPAVP